MYNHTDRTSFIGVWVAVDCQSILLTIVLTEADACALNCGHIVSNVRVAEVEMRRPFVGEGLQCTCYRCSTACGHV